MNTRIEKIAPYFIEMKVINAENETIIYINVSFNKNWVVPDLPSKWNVDFFKKDDGTWVFYTQLSNGEKELFDSIDFIIQTNLDIEKRQELFLFKMRELENIFKDENNDLKTLSTLTFNFKQKKNKNTIEKIQKDDSKNTIIDNENDEKYCEEDGPCQ
jgi:hypothetical protein